jgi:pimeloyl-ACP methyl ester carboxylesterase
VPLLLLYAKRDPMVPPAVGRALHALVPDARFEEIAEGSHFAHVDAPEAFLRVVLPFLGAERAE